MQTVGFHAAPDFLVRLPETTRAAQGVFSAGNSSFIHLLCQPAGVGSPERTSCAIACWRARWLHQQVLVHGARAWFARSASDRPGKDARRHTCLVCLSFRWTAEGLFMIEGPKPPERVPAEVTSPSLASRRQ